MQSCYLVNHIPERANLTKRRQDAPRLWWNMGERGGPCPSRQEEISGDVHTFSKANVAQHMSVGQLGAQTQVGTALAPKPCSSGLYVLKRKMSDGLKTGESQRWHPWAGEDTLLSQILLFRKQSLKLQRQEQQTSCPREKQSQTFMFVLSPAFLIYLQCTQISLDSQP